MRRNLRIKWKENKINAKILAANIFCGNMWMRIMDHLTIISENIGAFKQNISENTVGHEEEGY